MKYVYLAIVFTVSAFVSTVVVAQNQTVITQGSIEYEKRVNDYALLKEANKTGSVQENIDNYLKSNPQFQIYNYKLYFNNYQTLYLPVNPINDKGILGPVATNNTIFSDLLKQNFVDKKLIYNDAFLVHEDLRKIRWKITNETKEIAGFECRRANAIILDSIYVVAFYAVEIVPKGGPELFNGLPGMILGVSLPHEHISWFAKSVSITLPDVAIVAPQEGKEMSFVQLKSTLVTGLKSFGTYGQIIIKNIMY